MLRRRWAWRCAACLAGVLGIIAVTAVGATPTRLPRASRWGPETTARTTRIPARVEARVPFRVGEALTYDVGWSTYLTAGTAVATVKEKKPSYDSTAYYIVAEGRPTPFLGRLYPLYYKLDALLDSFTLLSQRGAMYSEEGGHRRFRATRFDRAARRAFFEDQSGNGFAVPPDTQDPLSALYALRAMPLDKGRHISGDVYDSGTMYRMLLDVGALERVSVPAGEFMAWNIQGRIIDQSTQQEPSQSVGIWISADPRRLPVKLQAEAPVGTFAFLLRSATD